MTLMLKKLNLWAIGTHLESYDYCLLCRFSCRSAFKLIEIDDKYKILKPGYIVVDCGAAPGSWTQVIVSRTTNLLDSSISSGCVIAIDKQYIHPIEVYSLI